MGFWSAVIIGRNDRLGVVLIDRRLLLAYLAGGLRLMLLLLFTALHALAHPIAHSSCVPHGTERLQPPPIPILDTLPESSRDGSRGRPPAEPAGLCFFLRFFTLCSCTGNPSCYNAPRNPHQATSVTPRQASPCWWHGAGQK